MSSKAIAALTSTLVLGAVLGPPYWGELIGIACVFGLFAASVDLAWGFGGVLNLGSALYFGLGSYFAAYAIRNDAGYVTGLYWGIAASLGIALIIGVIALRQRNSLVQFGLIGLVLSLIAQQASVEWYNIAGGSNGISGVTQPSRFFNLYSILVCGLCLGFMDYLTRSRLGRILICVRDEPLRAEASGYSPLVARMVANSVMAVMASIAGSLYVPLSGIAHPGLFGTIPNMLVLVWVAIGGQGSLWGPFLCAAGLKVLEFELGSQFENYYLLGIGVCFVSSVLFWPNGLAGMLNGRHRKRVNERAA